MRISDWSSDVCSSDLFLDLAAQATDLIVYSSIEGIRLPSLSDVEQLIAAQHLIGPRDERQHQIIFSRAERQRHALTVHQCALARFQHPRIKGVARAVRTMLAQTASCDSAKDQTGRAHQFPGRKEIES